MFRGMLQGRTDPSPSVFCILWSWQFVHIHIKLNHIKYTFLIIMYLTLYLCFVGGWEVELICSHHAVFWTYSHSHMILYSKIYHNSHHWNTFISCGGLEGRLIHLHLAADDSLKSTYIQIHIWYCITFSTIHNSYLLLHSTLYLCLAGGWKVDSSISILLLWGSFEVGRRRQASCFTLWVWNIVLD